MFGDLFPQQLSVSGDRSAPITVRLVLPPQWNAYASNIGKPQTEFKIGDPDSAPVVVGKKIRVSMRAILGKPFTMLTDGEWALADDEALEVIANVLKLHGDTMAEFPCESASLVLLPFPEATGANKWSAQDAWLHNDAVDGEVAIETCRAERNSGWRSRTSCFHFWVPNGLALSGDYDWFYEGFTMYQAARAGVRLDLLSFEQYLNALADAYDGSARQTICH
jgi:hypothetical protein